MIYITLEGRLGNQIFQYAFASAMAERLNTSFRLVGSPFLLPAYFDLSNFNPSSNAFHFWRHKIFNKIGIKKKTTLLENSKPIEENLSLVRDNTLFNGYYQSSAYFEPWIDIHKKIKVKAIFVEQFAKQYEAFFEKKKIVAVHVRRTDYVHAKHPYASETLCLPMSYYEFCLGKLKDLDQCAVFFLSDDLSFVKNHFGGPSNYHFDSNSEIMDLLIMMHADVVITANSSFSWWGAYLNKKKEKEIYAPKNWFGYTSGKEYPKGIMESPFNWC